jgi:hypothetical protein
MTPEESIRLTYNAYNDRNLDAALSLLHASVSWDDGQGKMLQGKGAISLHWQEQWQKTDAKVFINSIVREESMFSLSIRLELTQPDGSITSQELRNTIGFADDLIAVMRIA